jgi:hypothetical protein
MKKMFLFIAIVCFQAVISQVKKDVGAFDKIKVFDQIEVINKNGELKIRMSAKKLLDGEDIDAKVYFKQLTAIDANEGSFVGCDKPLTQTSIYVSTQEGAQVNLKLSVDKAEIKAATGGIIKLSGTAENQEASLGAGGILQAKNLKTAQTSVNVKAGGKAEIHASNLVDARVTAGGNIKIYGNPKEIKRKITLGGTIEEVRE